MAFLERAPGSRKKEKNSQRAFCRALTLLRSMRALVKILRDKDKAAATQAAKLAELEAAVAALSLRVDQQQQLVLQDGNPVDRAA